LRDTGAAFGRDQIMTRSAATAFYAALSLAPAMVLIVTWAGSIWGASAVRTELADNLTRFVGENVAVAVEGVIRNAHNPPARGWLAAISIATLVFAASAVFSNIQASLNTIWHVRPRGGPAVWRVVRRRLLALATLLIGAALIPISVLLSTTITLLKGASFDFVQQTQWIWIGANWGANVILFTLLFTALFKILSDAKLFWRDAWMGAFVTAVLFAIGKELLAQYLGQIQMVQAYGGAASFFLLLLWVYYSANIVYLGAEFTGVWAQHHGRLIRPDEDATWDRR
jgi:membrane protein